MFSVKSPPFFLEKTRKNRGTFSDSVPSSAPGADQLPPGKDAQGGHRLPAPGAPQLDKPHPLGQDQQRPAEDQAQRRAPALHAPGRPGQKSDDGPRQQRRRDPGPGAPQAPFLPKMGVGDGVAGDGLPLPEGEGPAAAGLRLPVIAGIEAVGIEIGEDGGNDTPVGHQDRVPPVGQERGKGRAHPVGHILSALAPGAAVAGIVSGEPGLIILPLPQLLIVLELKGAEVDLPESGERLAVDRAVNRFQRLAGAKHTGGAHPAALGLGVAPLGGPAVEGVQPRGAEGQIGLAAVKTLLVGHGGPVAEEIDLLLSHGLRPLSAPGGCRRTGG